MWRSYANGEREFCGIKINDGLTKDQRLPQLLITPSTKGILTGIEGVPAVDDVNITRSDIENNFEAFNFTDASDIARYEKLLKDGFDLISGELEKIDQVFVDTKFEFGYVTDASGQEKLIYMDEVGTPDSSRIWDGAAYREGEVVENSKEGFRQLLLNHFPDPDILLNKGRMEERLALAVDNELPSEVLLNVSATYISIAERITGQKIVLSDNPKVEIIDILREHYQLID